MDETPFRREGSFDDYDDDDEDLELGTEPGPLLPAPAWHPKLTVSRFFVIASTLGLGTAKALMSSRGETAIAVTIEWIMSIILFTVLVALITFC